MVYCVEIFKSGIYAWSNLIKVKDNCLRFGISAYKKHTDPVPCKGKKFNYRVFQNKIYPIDGVL